MQAFKNRTFSKWAAKEGLSDLALLAAVDELSKAVKSGALIEVVNNEQVNPG